VVKLTLENQPRDEKKEMYFDPSALINDFTKQQAEAQASEKRTHQKSKFMEDLQ